MSLRKLSEVFQCIQQYSDIIGFTIAEYLPFDEYRLHNIFSDISLFTE